MIMTIAATSMPISEAKTHLSDLVRRVHGQHERVIITVRGRPAAVLLSVEDLERLEENVAVLSSPRLRRAR